LAGTVEVGRTYMAVRTIGVGFNCVWRWKGLLWIIGMAMLLDFAADPAFSLLVRKHFAGEASNGAY